MILLKIRNLVKNYITKKKVIPAIDKLNLDVAENDFIVLVGPSGCGKSTILSIIGGLEDKSNGKIVFNKKNTKVGYMFQEDALFSWLTVYQNCVLGLKIQNQMNDENVKYVKYLIDKYGLKSFENSYPNELSGGMRQRVALIRTLATKPDILLLDEPFSALDYQTRIKVSDDVFKIIKEENKTALMVSHDIAEAVSLADKVVVLSKRPSKVKNIYEIKMSNKKMPSKNRENKLFNYYYNLIWKDLAYDEEK